MKLTDKQSVYRGKKHEGIIEGFEKKYWKIGSLLVIMFDHNILIFDITNFGFDMFIENV